MICRQKVVEAPQDASGIAIIEERSRQAAEVVRFLRVQVEIGEEGRLGRTATSNLRQRRWDICQSHPHLLPNLLLLREKRAPCATIVVTPSRNATSCSRRTKKRLACAALGAAIAAAEGIAWLVFADYDGTSRVPSAIVDIWPSSVR
ncbi:hypothetical protein HPB52_002837 [Rhipicephalus sanguineus]|uniref:Uncharacterized protein n=1 Tax=Rhipicephalus sanguineus TaxID=34632 RepID=A0A9D4SMU4_RHISA|nr:hypothetical protein HPB52_002837 [Rhipicephalus sanguineus]